MKILITGAAGFIGSRVADRMLAAGHQVIGLDDLSAGCIANVPDGVRLDVLSIASPAAAELIEREQPEVVIHMAARVGRRRAQEDPFGDLEINVEGTVSLALAAMRSNVRRFIFASSSAVYPPDVDRPARETATGRPTSAFGRGKLAAEKFLESLARVHGLEVICLRYASVYGPRTSTMGEVGLVATFARRMLCGESAIVFGDGRQTRDWLHVDDAADAAYRALTGHPGVYNIATGCETSVLSIYRALARLTRYTQPRVHGPAVTGEARFVALDPNAAGRNLSWRPAIPLERGLESTIRVMASTLSPLRAIA